MLLQSVEDELRGKQYLLNDISEMSLKLEEETDDESHKNILHQQVQSLKDHWHRVQQQSNEWLTRINLMWDLWRQYEQIKTDLEAWLTRAEEKMVEVWKASGNTVAELEELLTNHKVCYWILFISLGFFIIQNDFLFATEFCG